MGDSQVDWDTSQEYCSQNHTGMATACTAKDAAEIVKIAKSTTSSVWLGMKTDADGHVFCLNGDGLIPWTMPRGTPNNTQCVFVKLEHATLELGGCTDARNPLCYTEDQSDSAAPTTAQINTSPGGDDLRLVNGGSPCAGRVELLHDGQWGTVCDDMWGLDDAGVVCKQLGCGTALSAHPNAHFGEGSGPIWLSWVNCSGSLSVLWECELGGWGVHGCTHNEDAGVICSGSILRLANGGNPCAGRVEVYYYGEWKTVTDYNWHINNAAVVCNQLGCGSALAALRGSHFGHSNTYAWQNLFYCNGSESSLLDCRQYYNKDNWYSYWEAGVMCAGSEDVRLVNGGNCSGRVEVLHEGQWGTVCNDGWNMVDAGVVCQQLGCGSALAAPGSNYFGAGSGPVWLTGGSCSGEESALRDCGSGKWGEHNCASREDAGVQCTGSEDVRLVNGGNCSGRVEVFHEGQWGTVCSSNLNIRDLSVVCKQLGCGFAQSITYAFEAGTGPIWLSYISCTGSETALRDCTIYKWGERYCSHESDVGVICTGPPTTTPLTTPLTTPSTTPLTTPLTTSEHPASSKVMSTADLQSTSPSTSAMNTTLLPASTTEEPGADDLRLVNGDSPCSGTVEVRHEGQWGTVCSDYWSIQDAAVVCKQLGCETALSAPHWAHFGAGSGPVWLSWLNCSGSEPTLWDCESDGWGVVHGCDHSADAGVICSGNITVSKQFVFLNQEKSWREALKHCRTHYTELASMSDETDHSKLTELLQKQENDTEGERGVWLGLKNHMIWQYWYWADDRGMGNSHWAEGQPSNPGDELCGAVYLGKGGNYSWHDECCDFEMRFVCYEFIEVL
ncbi:deleted in malignant brain tumors 1 protein-like [Polyodon spathula]|uniref:deleted in malignant brain tumors 1 protein-like n=1 Tax=Polyodon spathula TaxID=7913 RepID=UPI001B7F28FB|nr:deleted in malignant brain tumors 1 protein-like [Polyodon spathula]